MGFQDPIEFVKPILMFPECVPIAIVHI